MMRKDGVLIARAPFIEALALPAHEVEQSLRVMRAAAARDAVPR
ncbi:MAG TPA: hypothetical protein PL106_08365 [Flavobacteriales bacterium]|nr:hypothetical protein [Flavobacteriales bacterium]